MHPCFGCSDLKMNKWVINEKHDENMTYDLIAVSNHFGGMGGGHCEC